MIAWAQDNVRILQALAAVVAILVAGWNVFLRDYIMGPPAPLATGYASVKCSELIAIDGDTVRCDGAAMRLLGDGAPFKTGVDAPELTRPKCEKERYIGQMSKDRLTALLIDVHHVEDSGARDPSDRKLVKVRLADGRTAGAVLISEGLAAVWYPGYKPAWCADTKNED